MELEASHCQPRFYEISDLVGSRTDYSHYSRIIPIISPLKLGMDTYRKTSNINRSLVGNEIIDNSDVVGASPVGAAPTTSSFSA